MHCMDAWAVACAKSTQSTPRCVCTQIYEVQSTAEPRPNAYIPEALGIPKPYGGFSPFKPSEQGSTMRHIRKPQLKEIVI